MSCGMHSVLLLYNTVVEGLEKSKQPQPAREAIYIIWPNEEVRLNDPNSLSCE